jgi:hypothetical protein
VAGDASGVSVVIDGTGRPIDGAGLAQGSGAMEASGPSELTDIEASGPTELTGIEAAGAIEATGAIEVAGAMEIPGRAEAIGIPLAPGAGGQATDGLAGAMEGRVLGSPDASCARTTAGPPSSAAASRLAPTRVRRDIAHLA